MATTTLGFRPSNLIYRTPCNVAVTRIFNNNIWDEVRSKSDTVKRKRPKGVELFFAPTSRQCSTQKASSDWAWPLKAETCLASTNPNVYKTAAVRPTFFKEEHGVSMPNPTFNRASNFSPLKSRTMSKIKKDGLNIWMQLFTYRQTAAVFTGGVKTMWEIFRECKRGRFLKAHKKASELYLYTRYALNPFLMDTDTALIQLKKELLSGQMKRFVAGYETKFHTKFEQNGAKFFDTEHVRMRWTSLVEFDNELLQAGVNTGVTNVQFALWDVVPFSFVVDWFIDVGTFLDNLDALFAVKRHVSWCTTRQKIERYGISPNNTMRYRGSKTLYFRDVVDLGGLPPLRISTGINLRRSLDALNLLNVSLKH